MFLPPRVRNWFNPIIAFAFDDQRLWSTSAPDGDIRSDSGCIALDERSRRVRAVGDAAKALLADPISGAGTRLVHGLGRGTVADHDVAEARFRYELRRCRSSFWSLTPRVLVTAPMAEGAKRAIANALINAGARDVITLPRVMAAAIGAGLPVDGERALVQIVADGDWIGAAVIARGRFVANWEAGEGLDRVAVARVAARRAPGDGSAPGIARELERLRKEGVAVDDATCRETFLHLRERLWEELATSEAVMFREAQEAPIWLAGSCAEVPGLAATISRAWGRPVTVTERPAEAPIRGARKVLGELERGLKSFLSK